MKNSKRNKKVKIKIAKKLTLADSSQVHVDRLRSFDMQLLYNETNHFQVVCIQYIHNKFDLAIILPKDKAIIIMKKAFAIILPKAIIIMQQHQTYEIESVRRCKGEIFRKFGAVEGKNKRGRKWNCSINSNNGGYIRICLRNWRETNRLFR